MGKSIVLSAVAAIALGASAASADAAVYDWSYTLTDGGGSGSGTFIAPAFTGSPVLISSAMGTIYSDPGLGTGPFIVTGLSDYAAADNTIYALGFDAPGQLSQGGISLATAAGEINLADYPGPTNPVVTNSVQNPPGTPQFIYGADITITEAPEASTWAMMVLGFAGLGFAGFRARRAAAAIA